MKRDVQAFNASCVSREIQAFQHVTSMPSVFEQSSLLVVLSCMHSCCIRVCPVLDTLRVLLRGYIFSRMVHKRESSGLVWQNRLIVDFVFEPPDFFCGFYRWIFLTFVGRSAQKILQENPRQNPQSLYSKIPDTFLQRGRAKNRKGFNGIPHLASLTHCALIMREPLKLPPKMQSAMQ